MGFVPFNGELERRLGRLKTILEVGIQSFTAAKVTSVISHRFMTDKPIPRQRAYQLRRVAEGMCGYCSSKKPLVPGTERCKKCTATNRKRAKARARKRAKARYRKSGAS